MYQKFIKLSSDSYLEVTTRLYNKNESVVLALRGTKDDTTPALASVVLDASEVEELLIGLSQALGRLPE